MRRKIVTGIVVGIMALSVGMNLYSYGYKTIFETGYRAGVNGISGAILRQLNDSGKVTLVAEGKQIVLVPEVESSE